MTDFFERKRADTGVALNEVQKQAVLKTDGPLLLLACPGSGKTTTMIMRIGYMIEEKGISPARIKPITFSKASARDMADRFRQLFPSLRVPAFSTIHSLAFGIAREHLEQTGREFALIEGEKQPGIPNRLALLKQSFRDIEKEDPKEEELGALSTYASYVKNRLLPESEWGIDGPFPKAGDMLRRYEALKRRNRRLLLLDFDDMLTIAEEGLRTDPDLCRRSQDRFDYVITDESQDTSLAQHRIVEHLVRRHRNLCAVADDDQSIYTWRGADPDYLLKFSEPYPGAEILMMETNYRSSEEIVGASAGFIKRNRKRYEKGMQAVNGSAGPVTLKKFPDRDTQIRYVIYELLAEENPGDAAILFRTNASSTAFVHELHRRGIPFYMKDADDRFFDHWVVEDVLNFMRLAYNPAHKGVFSRIALKMELYISRALLDRFTQSGRDGNVFDGLLEEPELKESQRRKLVLYRDIYGSLKGKRPAEVIRIIRKDLGYEEALKGRADKFGYRADALLDMLDTLESIAKPLRTMTEFAGRLDELKTAVKEAKQHPADGAVTLSTLHSSKGLEFRRVFMIDLIEGQFPSAEDVKDADLLEEARRLFYVGMTRAKARLELLSYERNDRGAGAADSRFVGEVRGLLAIGEGRERMQAADRMLAAAGGTKSAGREPMHGAINDPARLVPGLKIRHRVFGDGVVESVGGGRVSVQFTKQRKELDLDMCIGRGLIAEAGEGA
ncbi:ATP-dependent helicase [Edaphobacillus lindanitolerans]|uniref:DNA 3'-5' helicase n=1 Tax=Edaphobacillus lindanitolerans TaxID=550447 RepID=A0A1U7PMU6_9BACI|nr:ATP-dependent helicase [Edaphobacillus lindanitolerans]SIT85662.1 DNA helicase-2 / ATP-dependent DNA helicase PcrA [Edaphobacillus lindanitolerans]